MSQNKNDKVSYKYVVAHILQTQKLACVIIFVIQVVAFIAFLSVIPKSMTMVDTIFLTLMVLTFYCSAAVTYVGQYKEKLETGSSNPIWNKRFDKMTMLIMIAVAAFGVINAIFT
ncbi:hypothetical protein [Photobacterium damselae]|uniref:Uncharacterized protein n=1 Tax=Photobacterium damselae subsp. damselae TaxID=85581 RepID=A0A850QXV2_PHODD|nr:hypothetical protein [Photobacterium damselae]KAB1185681.1 hypothetical protein F6450_00900 [Photobacterium damselae subsp. damselae]MBE8127637.1 hypothetical protein [Photobacterium damselae subsp. piscicida]MCG3826507.1 hypothetical protein [Photobacterium damselae]NVP03436.1 hypothetical protein [Photobacterium damselae subsp. damselae]PSB85325.1 hypothetical protein C5F64_12565 [Photobacterium damselae subsp. damselae]